MAFPATDIVELLVLLVWASLTAPVHKHALFDQIFPDQKVLLDAVHSAPLEFSLGLFEAMQASSPPELSFFLNLPSDSVDRWGIYVLVLQKPGATPCIYIGSGTNAKGGVRTRLLQYDRKHLLPLYVKAALDDGYEIVHKGLILWCPIPSAAEVPRLRVLFVAIEAACSFLFWAMKSNSKDYGMSASCPWPRASFLYRGLCSHNAMSEGVAGDFDLSSEQLEEMAAVVKEKARAYMAEYHRRARLEDPVRLRERQRVNQTNFDKNSWEKSLPRHKRHHEKQKESKAFYCDVCEHASAKKRAYDAHMLSKRHLKKVASVGAPPKKQKNRETAEANKASKKYFCELCDVSCCSQYELDRHNRSGCHQKKVAYAESKSSSSSA